MGLLSTLHARGTWSGPFSLKDPALAELYGYGGKTLAGPAVNELLAFTVAAFWDGVQQQSADVAKLPLNLLKVRTGGGSDHYTESKTYKLMKTSPNPETRSLVFRRTVQAHALVYGNGYAEIVRDPLGRPAALWVLHPSRVKPFYEETPEGRKPLRYRIDGTTILRPMDVLHIQGLSDDAVCGFNLVSVAREALGLALASQQFAAAFFGNGTRFGGILTSDVPLDEDQKKEVRDAIERVHQAADRAFRLLVLGAGFKFHESGVKPNEAQMKELRDQQVTEIARFLNMPLHKLKLNTPGAVSYASVEMADLDYYKGPILTWTKTWEEELDAKLVPPLEQSRQYFKHNTNAFLRGDIKSRYDALGIARDKGIINADEWRELEDMNPQDGGQGKLYLVQSAQIPLAKMSEMVDAQIEKLKAPPPAPAPPPSSSGPSEDDRAILQQIIAEMRAALGATVERLEAAMAQKDQADVEALTREVSGLKGQIGTLEVLLAEKDTRIRETQAAGEALAVEIRESSALRIATAERDTDAERAKVAAAEEEKGQFEQRVADLAASKAAAEQRVADAETARAAAEALLTELTEERSTLLEARDAAQIAAQEARTLAEAAEEARQQAVQSVADANQDKDAARDMLREAEATLQAAIGEKQALEADKTAAMRLVDEAQARASAAEMARQEAEAAGTVAAGAVAEAEARANAWAQRVTECEAQLQEAERRLTESGQALAAASGAHELATAMAAEAVARAHTSETERATANAAHVGRLSAVLGAHRALIADVVQRLVDREIDRVQSRNSSPQKLKAWMPTFYGTFGESFVEAILPAVRVHLAWRQSSEDPRDLAQSLAQAHVDESIRQLTPLLDAETADFQVALQHLLTRWEKDRPGHAADALLAEEVAYLREWQ